LILSILSHHLFLFGYPGLNTLSRHLQELPPRIDHTIYDTILFDFDFHFDPFFSFRINVLGLIIQWGKVTGASSIHQAYAYETVFYDARKYSTVQQLKNFKIGTLLCDFVTWGLCNVIKLNLWTAMSRVEKG
jgi:hypothetical protein